MEDGKEDLRPRTRCGYLVYEAYQCYEQALAEEGAIASGKALHFAADLVCSGGLDIWIRGAYSYAITHIGLANPRIFVYLREKIKILDRKAIAMPQESFYTNREVQEIVSECVLVLQMCPKRGKITWPKIDPMTKRPGWLRGIAGAAETRATKIVWSADSDNPALYLVGNELCKAVQDSATERVFFWIRWTFEEDVIARKEIKTHGLSKKERGGAGVTGVKTNDVGFFMASILIEIYKELVQKGLVRMNEEFQELNRLWGGGEKRMPSKLRRECLGTMALICCEVPKWKIPAAATLVADPVRLSRAVSHATSFFSEVLRNDPLNPSNSLKASMMRPVRVASGSGSGSPKKMSEKEKQQEEADHKNEAYDAVMEAYLSKF